LKVYPSISVTWQKKFNESKELAFSFYFFLLDIVFGGVSFFGRNAAKRCFVAVIV